MNEIIEKRTKHAKHFDLGGGKRQAIITKHPQHYLSGGQWQDIRTDWVLEKGFGQKMQQAQHHLRLFNDGKEKLRFGFAKGVYVDYELPAALGVATKDAAKSGAWANADLRYTATPEGIKGEIILQAAGHPASFSFPLSAAGCTPAVDGNSLVYYADGKPVGRINAPYMEDAKGEIGTVALTYDAGVVTFTPDAKWLEGAAYPVTIDPTTTIQPGPEAGKDTHAQELYPTQTAGSLTMLRTGSTAVDRSYRSFIEFDLSSLAGATINSATLSLYFYYVSDNTSRNTSIHRITEAWVEDEVTWNNQPAYAATADATTSITSSGWYSWPVTSLVSNWVNGSFTNYGLAVKAVTEGIASALKSAYSSDYTTDTSLRPKLVVEYTEPPREGGSESTVTVTADGAGQKIGKGASVASATASASGAGSKIGQGGSTAGATVTADGAGSKTAIAGSDATAVITAEGSGSKATGGGSESSITVTTESSGFKATDGGTEATVAVTVEGAGEAYFVMPPEITIEQVGSKIRLSW